MEREGMHRRLVGLAVVSVAALGSVTPAVAGRDPYPHAFRHNMGYCAPYLAQQRLPDGQAVRPWINHLLHDLTSSGSFEAQKNVGDFYSDKARNDEDQVCVARS